MRCGWPRQRDAFGSWGTSCRRPERLRPTGIFYQGFFLGSDHPKPRRSKPVQDRPAGRGQMFDVRLAQVLFFGQVLPKNPKTAPSRGDGQACGKGKHKGKPNSDLLVLRGQPDGTDRQGRATTHRKEDQAAGNVVVRICLVIFQKRHGLLEGLQEVFKIGHGR